MVGVEGRVRVLPVARGSAQEAALLRRFGRVEPLLFDRDFAGAAVYRLVCGGAVLGLAVVEPRVELGPALDVVSCQCGLKVDLLEAVVILPRWRRHGLGRLFVARLFELHPWLVCVASENTDGFWRSLAPVMVPHPREACCFISSLVAAHVAVCGLCSA